MSLMSVYKQNEKNQQERWVFFVILILRNQWKQENIRSILNN